MPSSILPMLAPDADPEPAAALMSVPVTSDKFSLKAEGFPDGLNTPDHLGSAKTDPES